MKIELEHLLARLALAYPTSDIAKLCEEQQLSWSYSLVTTSLETGGPLIVGFNWGAHSAQRYSPQSEIAKADFRTQDLGSLRRILSYCETAFGADYLDRVSQTNYCFFRSKTESQITAHDLTLCEPIFDSLLSILRPSSILCFSSRLRSYLETAGRLHDLRAHPVTFERGGRAVTYAAATATMGTGTPISFLPHPNYPMRGAARDAVWRACHPTTT